MTGPEQMANSVIKSITGMTIEEIKVSAFNAQRLVLQFVEDVKTKMSGVQTSLEDINATQVAQRESLVENADIQNLILKKLDSMSVAMADRFDNVLFHLAQIENAIKLPLEPDMLEIVKKKAMLGLVDLGEAVTLNPTQVIPTQSGIELVDKPERVHENIDECLKAIETEDSEHDNHSAD